MNKKTTKRRMAMQAMMIAALLIAPVGAWSQTQADTNEAQTDTNQAQTDTNQTQTNGNQTPTVTAGANVKEIGVTGSDDLQGSVTTITAVNQTVQAAAGSTVRIKADAVAGKVARLKLTKTVNNGGNSQTEEQGTSQGESASIKVVEEDEKTHDLYMINSLEELPEEIELPDGTTGIVDKITLKLVNYQQSMGDMTVNLMFKMAFAAGDTVWILFACPKDDGSTLWFVVQGINNAEGAITITIPAGKLAELAGKTFVAFALQN